MAGGRSVAIVHPLKSDGADSARDQLAAWARAARLDPPEIVETTAESPGSEQAREAVASGAEVVVAWGGDGTVTAVVEGLVGSGVPLGIIPAGTGNLLARNLDIPLSFADAGPVAFGGEDRTVDVVEIGLGGRTTVSTVIAGMGLDAKLIDVNEDLKNAIGASAYVVNTARAVRHKKMRVGVAVDGGAPQWFSARSVMVANVGGLIAGLDVAPEADASDGLLHVVVLPLVTPVDWARTAARLVRRRAVDDSSRIHLEGTSAWVVTANAEPRQIDGDVVEPGRVLQARVRPGSLVVRVPRGRD